MNRSLIILFYFIYIAMTEGYKLKHQMLKQAVVLSKVNYVHIHHCLILVIRWEMVHKQKKLLLLLTSHSSDFSVYSPRYYKY